MNNGNGSVKWAWLANGLLSILLLAVSGWVAANNSRITALEEFKSDVAIDINTLKWDLKRTREDVCRLEGKVDDLTEWVTKRRAYRTPCP